MDKKTKKVMKRALVLSFYFIFVLIVEVWVGVGICDVWDKVWKWADK